ncbi:MAG: VanZ family protein [Bacteroidales bacterium]|nr:VanZ family protein [Bacteroidales bacterium]
MGKRNVASLVLFVIYLAVLIWCCFGHFDDLPSVDTTLFGIPTDKIVHFIMFLPFPVLCFKSFSFLTPRPRQALLALAVIFIIGCLLAAGTEIGQSFTKYRSGDPFDFTADVVALAISSVATFIVWHRTRKNKTV